MGTDPPVASRRERPNRAGETPGADGGCRGAARRAGSPCERAATRRALRCGLSVARGGPGRGRGRHQRSRARHQGRLRRREADQARRDHHHCHQGANLTGERLPVSGCTTGHAAVLRGTLGSCRPGCTSRPPAQMRGSPGQGAQVCFSDPSGPRDNKTVWLARTISHRYVSGIDRR